MAQTLHAVDLHLMPEQGSKHGCLAYLDLDCKIVSTFTLRQGRFPARQSQQSSWRVGHGGGSRSLHAGDDDA